MIEIPGWRHVNAGKVRDLYVPVDSNPDGAAGSAKVSDRVLIVASDRISAYDFVLDSTIPGKGEVLTQLSLWWFEQLADIVPNHVLPDPVPPQVAGRAMICRRLEMYPVECVARGYLTGSGLVEYKAKGEVCGVGLPAGLREASRLDPPIYTPAIKAELGEHDENVSNEVVAGCHGKMVAARLKELTLAVYQRAAQIARERGLILADTKFEFGALPGAYVGAGAGAGSDFVSEETAGSFVLGDEVLTPDSSRFWPLDEWVEGQVTPSFDKQYVRDWLTGSQSGWDRASGAKPPALPQDVIERTAGRYREAFERLTGRSL